MLVAGVSGFIGCLLALMLVVSAGGIWANPTVQSGAPGEINYQGYLEDSNGDPIGDPTPVSVTLRFKIYDASTGGNLIWEETKTGVNVSSGFFSVALGSSTPLTASDFDSTERYLQTELDVNNTGSYTTLSPRQRFRTVPYAFQAAEAAEAASVDWNNVTNKPTLGADYENVIVVAKSGGDYTSVVDALNSISSPSSSNRYLVKVMPGVYTESSLVDVPDYVHLKGAGINVTVIQSSRTSGSASTSASTAAIDGYGVISDMTIKNTGTSNYSIGIYVASGNSNGNKADITNLIDTVRVEVVEDGGLGSYHYGIYTATQADVIVQHSVSVARNATTRNAAFVSTGDSEPFIVNTILRSTIDNTGDVGGYALYSDEGNPNVRDSELYGADRSVYQNNGFTDIQFSVIGFAGIDQIEQVNGGRINIASSQVSGNVIGTVKCFNTWDANLNANDCTSP